CVSFNGEIYNYPELKAELEQRGHVFRTRSDTEVLLALYVRDGLEAFAQLNGMFACAFWDRAASRLVLVRDRLGKKPLFYYRDAQRVLFASEIKALLAFGGVERTVSLRALHEYLTYGYIVGEQAILEGVHRVEPGEAVVVHAGHVSRRPYRRPSTSCPTSSGISTSRSRTRRRSPRITCARPPDSTSRWRSPETVVTRCLRAMSSTSSWTSGAGCFGSRAGSAAASCRRSVARCGSPGRAGTPSIRQARSRPMGSRRT